ncbi:MAG TPA: outer membrane beta-barrel protein [Patescibacteria group bacterium]|nr:outer membrane beta-barrel protein [Patescibacteria group bacterium]
MKHILLLTAVALCLLKNELPAQNFSIGFKAGQSFSRVEGADATFTLPFVNKNVTPEGKLGFTGGISLSYEFLPMFGVQLEGVYAKKGAMYKDNFSLTSAMSGQLTPEFRQLLPLLLGLMPPGSDSVKFSGDFTGEYIEVPLLFTFTPDFDFALKPSLYAGPNFAFLTNQSQNVQYESPLLDQPLQLPIPIPLPFPINLRDFLPPVHFALKDFDMGFTFGGGVAIDFLKSASLGIEARYTIGFNSAVDSVGYGATSFAGFPIQPGSSQKDPDVKNRSLAVMGMLRYRF